MIGSCAALIVAAGSGIRFKSSIPKQYQLLAGEPVLRHSVLAFLEHEDISFVQVVINPNHQEFYNEAVKGLNVLPPIYGGASRQESVLKGLEAIANFQKPDFIMIHDAARPLVDAETISSVRQALKSSPGATAARPVVDTLKRGEGNRIVATVDRANLWQAYTPQAFSFDLILEAHRKFAGESFTDDNAVAEKAGIPITLVPCNPDNMKITNPEDLERATRILQGNYNDLRVGYGFDVHRLIPGKSVRICGIDIEHDHSLSGHSDADVALHAVVDALLGTIADGDIGSHFPPDDAKWRGADSALFVEHAVEKVKGKGGIICHIDITIICEKPKIKPHREAMRSKIAELLGVEIGRVSIKATTTEQLGFTGRGEGIAAQAIATVRFQ